MDLIGSAMAEGCTSRIEWWSELAVTALLLGSGLGLGLSLRWSQGWPLVLGFALVFVVSLVRTRHLQAQNSAKSEGGS
jgi:predicted Kef-type K+ transport protein